MYLCENKDFEPICGTGKPYAAEMNPWFNNTGNTLNHRTNVSLENPFCFMITEYAGIYE
jgi:hypothetical protein